jgi:Zn-dependent peptidase ImmA (M78 family)
MQINENSDTRANAFPAHLILPNRTHVNNLNYIQS